MFSAVEQEVETVLRSHCLNTKAKHGVFRDLLESEVVRFMASSGVDGALYCGQKLDIAGKSWKDRYEVASDDCDWTRTNEGSLSWLAFAVKSLHLSDENLSDKLPTKYWCFELEEQEKQRTEFLVIVSHVQPGYVTLLPRTVFETAVAEMSGPLSQYQRGSSVPTLFQPYTFPQELLRDAMKNVRDAALGLRDYVVPFTGVVVRNWKPKLTSLDDIGYINITTMADDPNISALAHFDMGVEDSGVEGVSWDFIQALPYVGDALLLGPNEEKFGVIMEDDSVIEDGPNIIIDNSVWGKDALKKGKSHPYRTVHFVWVINRGKGYGYWIPASQIQQEWALSVGTKLEVPSAQLSEFRVDLRRDDWFKHVWENIISVYANPLDLDRFDQMFPVLPKETSDIRKSNAEGEHGNMGTEENKVDKRLEGLLHTGRSAPDRLYQAMLQSCSSTGEGMILPLGPLNEDGNPNFVFFDWTWSDKDRKEFSENGRLPQCFDHEVMDPAMVHCLPILLYHTYSREHPRHSTVKAQDLQDQKFPYLLLCEILPPDVTMDPQPCYFIPSKVMAIPKKTQEVEALDAYLPRERPLSSYTLSDKELHHAIMTIMTKDPPDEPVSIGKSSVTPWDYIAAFRQTPSSSSGKETEG
ncbi:uncharacterized protein K452DRAFT_301320 [Aplosporella prunicola CBS 121167]|uniref:Uncharacterized protein n=1 Tax=Aplosporella prunicola CBS 121167 TaxID=1176127 RepID=A0A6A6B435_9PEZI|nr:uncharacterized protein K452DRAFT_301320 [Aplosporella prunicola CBS 121167]KAF2138378.1 hypothetical protein K452DRAFT_301320 [Aplosporella prunicola CBS 121167]